MMVPLAGACSKCNVLAVVIRPVLMLMSNQPSSFPCEILKEKTDVRFNIIVAMAVLYRPSSKG